MSQLPDAENKQNKAASAAESGKVLQNPQLPRNKLTTISYFRQTIQWGGRVIRQCLSPSRKKAIQDRHK
jgi:hypothetical protein